MKTVEEARAEILRDAKPFGVERVALDGAFGRVLAEDIHARGAQPPFDASAMDGWAVRRADLPAALRIIGESAAGAGFVGTVEAGEAVRIFTGAPVPAGADSVVIQEEARRDGDLVHIEAARGDNVRPRGMDFNVGDELLAKGARLDGVALALAAAAGFDPIAVTRRPRVAILATGDELVRPGAPLGADQIFESVSFGIAGLARHWGADARRLSAAGDDVDSIARAFEKAGEAADLIVTIGGASVGDHDLVKPAAKARGANVLVENVAMRPGKPLWFARAGALAFLGLPGNPASALVCAHLFLRPLLDRWTGRVGGTDIVRATLASPLPANGPRAHYVRALLKADDQARLSVTPFESQDSARLTVFQRANALIRMAPRAPASALGDLVEVVPLDRL